MTDEQRLQMITEQLILVRDNLFRGMSKSIQKLQARSINELLELPSHTQSPPAQQEPFGYFKAEPFGWTDCAETDEGAIALYEHPQPAQPDYQALEPALTRLQKRYADLEGKVNRPWVGLTDEERNHARQTVTYSQLAMTAGEWAEKVQIETERRLKEKNT